MHVLVYAYAYVGVCIYGNMYVNVEAGSLHWAPSSATVHHIFETGSLTMLDSEKLPEDQAPETHLHHPVQCYDYRHCCSCFLPWYLGSEHRFTNSDSSIGPQLVYSSEEKFMSAKLLSIFTKSYRTRNTTLESVHFIL